MKQLSPSKLHPASANGIASTPTHDANSELKLILGGYSYGSIIVSRLPPLREILYTFRNMQDNIAIAEILQRARTISQWTHEKLDSVRQANGTPPRQSRKHSPSVTIGGDEIQTDHGRISREGGRRSIDLEGLRKSLDIPKRIKEHKRQTQSWGQRSSSVEPEKPDNGNWPSPKPHYLLLSPVLGLVGSALSAFDSSSGAEDVKDTLAKEPTLVIYADKDVFTSTKKVRQWTQTISSRSEDFRAVEVNGAGHFWREPGVIRKLRSALGVWVQELQIESR
ncbi:MAG: hypothetical protein M1822_009488 [Bathelium mastoideum]|nr:MAG: hypothetical protein M1822_009488 [Bathelium mastoideum]